MTAAAVHDLLVSAGFRDDLNDLARRLATTAGACGWHVTDAPDLSGVRITVYGTDDPVPEDEGRSVANVRQVEHIIGAAELRQAYIVEEVIGAAVRSLTDKVDAWEARR